jgi:hypothetical protein
MALHIIEVLCLILPQSKVCITLHFSFVTAKNDPFDPFGDGGVDRSASKTPVDVSYFRD